VDAPEVVKFLSDEQASRKEQEEDLSDVTLQSQVEESSSGDHEAGSVSEQSPVDVIEIEHRKSTRESNDGAIEEEDVVDVHEDWSVSIVEDLDVLTRSWSVGVPASNPVAEHETCREDFVEKDDDENATMSVESKSDEEKAVYAESEKEDEETTNLNEEDDEKDEMRTEDVSQEEESVETVYTPPRQVETKEEALDENDSEEDEKRTEDVSQEEGSIETVCTPPREVKTKEEDLDEDDYDLVYGEFLNLLRDPSPPVEHSESGEDSPRAQLLKQFEQEALIEGGLELNFHLPEYAKFRVEGAQENDKSDANAGLLDQPAASPFVPDNVTDVFDNAGWFWFSLLQK